MRTKLLLLLYVLSLQAQVGIDTKTPKSMLDVKGDIKIGNEEKTNKQGEAGMLRWNKDGKCLESHDGES